MQWLPMPLRVRTFGRSVVVLGPVRGGKLVGPGTGRRVRQVATSGQAAASASAEGANGRHLASVAGFDVLMGVSFSQSPMPRPTSLAKASGDCAKAV